MNGRTHFTQLLTALLLGLAMLAPAQAVERVIHYHNDALGSPIAATDQEGRVVWRKSYAPYGQPIGPGAPNEPGYTGKFEEPDLGIQNFGARWYDPRIGRFLAIDPAGFDPQNPQSFNRYAYANNNPYRFVDPDGNSPLDAGFFIADTVSLGLAAASGNSAAIQSAAFDFAASAVGLASPVPGTGLAIKAARAADRMGDAARVGKGARDAPIELTHAGERFVRVGHKPENLKFTFGTPGGTQPGTYAFPEATLQKIGSDPAKLKDLGDLPGAAPEHYRILEPPPGTPIQRGTVPGGEFGGQGGIPEVRFPEGF